MSEIQDQINSQQRSLTISVDGKNKTALLFDLSPTVTSNGNIVADTMLNLSVEKDNKKNNSVLISSTTPTDEVVVDENISSLHSLNLKYKTVGQEKKQGGFNFTSGAPNWPNIYLNFRKKTFSNSDLEFRFSTRSLTGSSTATGTWSCESGVKNPFNLVGDAGCLTPVGNFGVYTYKFANKSGGNVIANNTVKMIPRILPSYTTLVFAVGTTSWGSSSGGNFAPFNGLLRQYLGKRVQKFTLNEQFGNFNVPDANVYSLISALKTSDSFFDWSYVPYFNLLPTNTPTATFSKGIPTFAYPVFVGNILNHPRYMGEASYGLCNFARKSYEDQDGGVYPTRLHDRFLRNYKFAYTKQSSLDVLMHHNISNWGTSLANTTTPQQITLGSTVYPSFSIFFVQMFSTPYIADNSGEKSYMVNETYVNGFKTCEFYSQLIPGNVVSTPATYLIQLFNDFGADYYNDLIFSNSQMFLFDYSYGLAQTPSEMYQKSYSLVESIAYDIKGFLVKNSSNLQLTNSTSSLRVPIADRHPYVNMFLNNPNSLT